MFTGLCFNENAMAKAMPRFSIRAMQSNAPGLPGFLARNVGYLVGVRPALHKHLYVDTNILVRIVQQIRCHLMA